MKNTYIVIAAYNEQDNIVKVVRNLKKAGYSNVVVVDDGSGDNTYIAAAKAGAVALQHPINRGQGAALKTGIDYALLHGADIIVTFDADGQHRVEDLPAMIKPVAEGKVDYDTHRNARIFLPTIGLHWALSNVVLSRKMAKLTATARAHNVK